MTTRSPGIRFLCALLALSVAGCSARHAPSPPPARASGFRLVGTVALAPLDNLTGRPDASRTLERVMDEALRTKGISVVGAVDDMLPPRRAATRLELQHAAATLGASYLLLGSVLEYGYRENKITGGPSEPVVSIDLRLVDVVSGQVIWENGFTRSSHEMMELKGEGLGAISVTLADDVAHALSPRR